MKKFIIILISIILLGCSKPDKECDCVKETYETEQYVWFDADGLPHLGFRNILTDWESNYCADGDENYSEGELLIKIICDIN